MPYQLRTRKDINWKLLSEGGELPKLQQCQPVVNTLPRTYEVERIISGKQSTLGYSYLVKWLGYHHEESTWEPESHIPDILLDNYMSPVTSPYRLESAAFSIENVFQQRLKSTNCRFLINFEHDVFRYCFGTDSATLLHKSDFDNLPLSAHWYYLINKNGRGKQISFPVKLEPKLWNRKVFVQKEQNTVLQTVPVENIIVNAADDGLRF